VTICGVVRRWLALFAILVAIAVAVVLVVRWRAPSTGPDRALDQLWNDYGDAAGGHWTGGDRTDSVPLPDGRILWLFSDTFLGPVNPDGSRPGSAPLIHNSMVVERDGRLGPTLTGGTPAHPASLVSGPDPAMRYWVGDATVEGNQLRVLYNLLRQVGNGGLDLQPSGTALATFSLPDLKLVDVHTLPLSTNTAWGSSIMEDGGFTYIYGSEHNGSGPKYVHLARVPAGGQPGPGPAKGLSGAWQFWTGHGWSAAESDSTRLLTGVGTAYSVTHIGAAYVLVTFDTNITLNRSVLAYSAPSPTGPFGPPTTLFGAPEVGSGVIAYDSTVHPELGSANRLVVSYNVNSLDPDRDYADVDVYRPRFYDVAWPPPSHVDSSLPVPTAVSASIGPDGGTVHVGWSSAGSGLTYQVYEQDVSFGQTYPVGLTTPVSRTFVDLPFLRDGHTYQFTVAVLDRDGSTGPMGRPVSLTVHLVRPPPPTGLAAQPDSDGTVTLRWSAARGPVWYTVYQRDLTAGEAQPHPLALTDTTHAAASIGPLAQDHTYAFVVTASNGAGESDASLPAGVTAHADPPPAPHGLRAQASDDGRVLLTWTTPAVPKATGADGSPAPAAALPRAIQAGPAPLRFQVYQRDVTAGEAAPVSWPSTVDTTQVHADTLRSGHTYEFWVATVALGGTGPMTGPVSVRVTGGLPGAVSTLDVQAGDSQVTLVWSTVPGPLIEYVVYRRDLTLGEATYTQLPVPVIGDTVTDTTVYNGHLYLYRVAASNVHGQGGLTAAVLAQPMPPRPSAPTGLRAQPGDHSAMLTWAAPGPGLYYFIYRRDVSAGEAFRRFPLPVMSGTAFTDAGLINGDTYQYKVSGTNIAGEGPTSTVVDVVPGS
jgi:hypothetical protein